MSVVGLEILEPKNGANVVGTKSVRMLGRVLTTGHGALFFKWYSSLVPPPAPTEQNTDTSLNRSNLSALDFTPTLHVGSQVITFTARDVAGDAPAQLAAVREAGMAGGPPVTPPPPGAPPPCVIHVLFAEVVTAAATLSRANATLEAKAPPLWADAVYQAKVNRLRFRWRFDATGLPADRPAVDFEPGVSFGAPPAFDKERSVLSYKGALPPQLVIGSAYLLRLRVERRDDPAVFHQSEARTVSIVS